MAESPRDGVAGCAGPRLRVAAIIDTSQVSGPGRQLAALAPCLAEDDVELLVVTFHRSGRSRSPYLDYLERGGVRYAVLHERGVLDGRLIAHLGRLLGRWRPDIVQTHGYKPTALACALRLAGARWPWIAFFHGATAENRKVRFYNWLHDRLLGRADRVVVMSREHLDRFGHLGARVCVLHNAAIALPPVDEHRAALLTRGPGDAPRPRVGVVGRLSPEKGVDVFLHACAELVRRGTRFSAVVAGDGPERLALERLRIDLGLEHQVAFMGATPAVRALYESLDVMVIPSRSEGLPNVLLEALNADVPVVATSVGAIPEVLGSSSAGVIVPPSSPRALADAIERAASLKADPGSRESRRAIVERFSVDRRAREHLRLYGELLAGVDPAGTGALGIGGRP